jgi:hypothetical protein
MDGHNLGRRFRESDLESEVLGAGVAFEGDQVVDGKGAEERSRLQGLKSGPGWTPTAESGQDAASLSFGPETTNSPPWLKAMWPTE